MKDQFRYLFLFALIIFFPGCIGFDPPNPLDGFPISFIKGQEQVGGDQITNRFIVAKKMFPLKNKDSNEILSFLGQPQQIKIIEKGISEDWVYVYYKNVKDIVHSGEGAFMVRFYRDKVIDVVRDIDLV